MRYRFHEILHTFILESVHLVAIDNVSKWVVAITFLTNNAKVVIKFLENNILTRFGIQGQLVLTKGHISTIKLLTLC